MNIAFVTPEFVTEECYDGGLANYLARVAPGLVGLGHHVTIIVRSTVDELIDWNGVRVRRVAVGGAPLFFLGSMLRDIRLPLDWIWSGWKLALALRELHRSAPFDVIQYASFTAPALFRLRGVPAVVRLSSYEPLLREAWKVELTFARRLQEYIEKMGLRRADALFSPSRLIAEAAAKRTGRLVEVIESPYARSIDVVDDRPWQELLAGRRYLLFFGSIGVLKGVETIAEIIRPLLESHSDLRVVFVGKDVGFRGRPMMQHVWEMAGPCRGRVLYLGKMRHGQLLPVVRQSLAVLLPSRLDNFPSTCIEAMAEGKAVIGTRGTSFEQLIDDGVSGLLCEIDDPKGLRDAIERLLGESGLADSLGAQAQARAARLSGPQPLQALIDFYCRLMPQKAGGVE